MTRRVTLVVPGSFDARTGGYEYDRQLRTALVSRGWDVALVSLDASFPFPTPAARAAARGALAALPDGALVLVDGLAFGVLASEARAEANRLRLVALVHHPLALETGLDPAVADRLEASERAALAAARQVIVTSPGTRSIVARFGVPLDRITVAEPGTPPAPLARGSGSESVRLLCVASVTARKGHRLLIEALAGLRDLPWTLVCAGGLDRDAATADDVRQAIASANLGDRVQLVGELASEALAFEYDRADLFVLPTVYEGYGMAVAEALARGLPVVSTDTGAIADIVAADAGIVVTPGDGRALREALLGVLSSAELRAALADGARRARTLLPQWDDTARQVEGALAGAEAAGAPAGAPA